MKKIILISLSFVILLSSIFIFSNNKKLIFSDYLLFPLDEDTRLNNYDYSFSNINLTSELLNEYLDNNALNLKTKKRINSLIKKSKEIYLSVGLNDLFSLINNNEGNLEFNYSLFTKKMALLEYNIHEIISSILAIKDVDIYYFSLYYLNDKDIDVLIYEFNLEIKDLLNSFKVNYIEVNDYIKINDFRYTLDNQKALLKALEMI